MEAGDRVAWNPAWDNLGAREGVVLAPPGGRAETTQGYVLIGSAGVLIRFDDPINGYTDYVVSTLNVEVIS
jgi:hypothetical protein